MHLHRKALTITGSSTLAAAAIAAALWLPGTAAAGSAALPLAPAAVTTSAAPTSTPAGAPAVKKDLACRGLTRVDTRLKKVEARLSGSATTKGSVAWLTARAAAATKAGHPAEAKRLTAKATKRHTELTTLTKQEHDLAALIAADCG